MGIYIPDMEMPKDGQMLIIFPDGTAYVCFNGMRERLAQAEAVSVQPHGKLGDLDTLQKQIDIARNYGMIGKTAHYKLQKLIKEAPTIIPAEEGKT